MEDDITKAFVLVQSELTSDINNLCDLLEIQALVLRSEIITRVDNKILTFLATILSTH